MKQTISIIIHGFGAMCILIGFCVFIGAGGASDLGANMATEVMPMLTKGALILFGGIFLSGWRV